MDEPFTAEIIDAVRRHMNDEHRDDCLTICRAVGAEGVAATLTALDPDGVTFRVTSADGEEADVQIEWETVPITRQDIRHELVWMVGVEHGPA